MNRDLGFALVFLALVVLLWLPDGAALIVLTIVDGSVAAFYLTRYWRSKGGRS